jgi:hypothetical protein
LALHRDTRHHTAIVLSLSSSISARNRHKAVSQSTSTAETPSHTKSRRTSRVCVWFRSLAMTSTSKHRSKQAWKDRHRVLPSQSPGRNYIKYWTVQPNLGRLVLFNRSSSSRSSSRTRCCCAFATRCHSKSCCQNPSFGSILGRRCLR